MHVPKLRRGGSFFALATALFLLCLTNTHIAQANNAFYQGKTVRFIVGASPGGGFDTYTRMIAEYIPRHIPGQPTIIVENKPGAASLVAARYLYNVAKPDGFTVAMFDSNIALHQALGSPSVDIDSARFRWLGAPVRGYPVCAVMGFTQATTLADIRAADKPFRMGGLGSGSVDKSVALPLFLNNVLGQKFDVIRGYKGSSKVRLAMQQKEVDGICLSWESLRATGRAMLDASGDDKLIPFTIHGDFPDPEVQNIPQLMDVLEDEQAKQMFTTWVQPFNFQRPFALPPGTPDESLQIMRAAFQKTLRDPDFLALAERAKLLIDPVTAEEIEQYVDAILSTPESVLVPLKALLSIE